MSNEQLSFEEIDNAISKYFPGQDFIKFKQNIPIDGYVWKNSSSGKKSLQRNVTDARHKKYMVKYGEQLRDFICENIIDENKLSILTNLGETFYRSGYSDASLKFYYEVIDQSKHKEHYKSIYAHALFAVGRIYSDKEQWKKSNGFIRNSLRLFGKMNDNKGMINCYNLLAIYNFYNNNLDESLKYFEKCLKLSDIENNLSLRAKIEMNMGVNYGMRRDYKKALHHFRIAIFKYEKLNDPVNVAILRYNMGNNYYELNKIDMALKELDKGMQLCKKYSLLKTKGYIYNLKALTYLKKNDLRLSVAFWQKALKIYENINDTPLKYDLIVTRGIIARYERKFASSEKYFMKFLNLIVKSRNILFVANIKFELGYLYRDWGRYEKAVDSFKDALRLYKKMNIVFMVDQIGSELTNLSVEKIQKNTYLSLQ